MKIAESLGVIYIVRFNKNYAFLGKPKMSN